MKFTFFMTTPAASSQSVERLISGDLSCFVDRYAAGRFRVVRWFRGVMVHFVYLQNAAHYDRAVVNRWETLEWGAYLEGKIRSFAQFIPDCPAGMLLFRWRCLHWALAAHGGHAFHC